MCCTSFDFCRKSFLLAVVAVHVILYNREEQDGDRVVGPACFFRDGMGAEPEGVLDGWFG